MSVITNIVLAIGLQDELRGRLAEVNVFFADYSTGLVSIDDPGADEFAVRFMYAGDHGKDACDRLVETLAFASIGKRTRECTVTHDGESNPRSVEVWHFDPPGRQALRQIMPDGVPGSSASNDAWAEDLCVYRRGKLVFGTVTHERYAFVRLTGAEWRQWEAQAAAERG